MNKNQQAALEYDLRKIIVEVAEAAQEGEICGNGHTERIDFYEAPDDLADPAVKRCMAVIDEHQHSPRND